MIFLRSYQISNTDDKEHDPNKLNECNEVKKEVNDNQLQNEYILFFFKKNNLLEKLHETLENGSYCQKDTSLLILSDLSLSNYLFILDIHTCNLLKTKETIDLIMNHLKGFFIKSKKD
jgi:hypothetical protein